MAQSAALLTRLLATCVSTVARTGKIVQDVLNTSFKIVDKGKNDFQTEADRAVERFILATLNHKFPDLKILGEEGFKKCKVPSDSIVTDMDPEVLKIELPKHLENVDPKDICIWIDPIDGTSEYVHGLLDHVTVLIGIAVKEKAIGGVIFQPFYKSLENVTSSRTVWGIVGVGIGGDIKASPPPSGKRILVTTRTHSNEIVDCILQNMEPDEVLRVGGAGHKVLLLLEGKAHAYIYPREGCKKWDTCGPEAILHAAGGVLTNVYGENYCYNSTVMFENKGGVIATAPGQQHQWYLNRVTEEVKEILCKN